MEIGRVIGNVWATKKDGGITGQKLLVIDLVQSFREKTEALVVAADVIGAGAGDLVLVCRGNSARMVVGNGKAPVDAAVVGIIDSLDLPAYKNEEVPSDGHQ
ncbi:MAG: EutN/CcmL family microcompartment protein [Candidatus Limivivens sp.]|nr:EutN/CcmL family microcompartment protein [Candidatus Limivivens sp.]